MSAEIPAITRCWQRVAVVLPPSDPTNPDDPSVSLDTLAAIAHAATSERDDLRELLGVHSQESKP